MVSAVARQRACYRGLFVNVPETVVRVVAVLAAGGFLFVAGFQSFLALGAPWGRAAYGGFREVLPVGLRVGSAFSAAVLVVAALVVLGRAGYWGDVPVLSGVFRWGTWALVALVGISGLVNFASSSPWERFLWGPLGFLVAVLCLVVALGG